MEAGDLEVVYDIIWTVKFFIETFGLHQTHNLVVSRVLEQTKNQKNKENSVKVQLIVLDLINVLVTKLDRSTLPLSLDIICSQDTFKLLLDIITTSNGEQKLSAIETISGLIVSAEICLESRIDLDLVLALVDADTTDMVSHVLHNAVAKKKIFSSETREIAFKEVWNVRNKKEVDVDEMLLSLMVDEEDVQDTELKYPTLVKPDEHFFSPLIISLLQSQDTIQFAQEFIHRIKFLFDDSHIFMEVLESHDTFKNSAISPATTSDNNKIFCNKTTMLSHILENLSVSKSSSMGNIRDIIDKTPPNLLPEICHQTIKKISKENKYNPFIGGNYEKCVQEILNTSKTTTIDLTIFSTIVSDKILRYLKSDKVQINEHNEDVLQNCLEIIPIPHNYLLNLFDCLLQISIQKYFTEKKLLCILTGLCSKLTTSDVVLEDTMFAKMLCMTEVLVSNESCETDSMIKSLSDYLKMHPTLVAKIGTNLVTVLLKNPNTSNLEFLETMLTSNHKHFETVKTWICQEKQQFSCKIWPLVKLIMSDKDHHVEKKFITIVLRHVMHQVEDKQSGKVGTVIFRNN